ncbi:MAG: LysM peptidoglycan-binding domain-containing protein [Pseudomonadaceae bacterium]|nr:LysM peptidoglycan-binding domain-containing protein [Pseudomonadaceae bacterium]
MVMRKATPLMLLVAVGVCLALPARAGMMEWVDNIFTFREDQKERVSPRRNIPPKVVYSPHYDENDHAAWSGYYTREDLNAQTYIAGSGSKVMRPAAPPVGAGGYGGAGGQYDRGFGTGRSSTYIGDPGTGPAMVMGAADANLGGSTRIGNAVRDWRDGAPDGAMGRRPGDYDYRVHANNAPSYSYSQQASPDTANRAAEGPYIRFNNAGEVTQYRVQRGDTLSTIADQPRIYQNWRLWPLIYDANRAKIGRDPDDIYPKQRLDIPRGYSSSDARAAERRADQRGPSYYGDGR